MTISEQGDTVIFYATFVDSIGEPAVFTATPVVSVFHRQGTKTEVDFLSGAMTTLNGKTYYFRWNPTARAHKGDYVARYGVTYTDGSEVESDESFQIINRGHYEGVVGGMVKSGRNVPSVWSKKEKEKTLKVLDSLAKKVLSPEEFEQKLSDSVTSINDFQGRMKDTIDKQHDSMLKIESLVEELQNKELTVDNFDDSNIMSELASLKKDMGEFDNLTEKMRVPLIISELEELRVGLENFQRDLAKSLSTEVLERGTFK